MAKKEYDSNVVALIDLKDMISNFKSLTNVIAIEPHCGIIYMYFEEGYQDCYAIIRDTDLMRSAENFTLYLLNTVECVAFNKALKKTKTISEIKSDESLNFSTDGYDIILNMPKFTDYNQITSKYKLLFRDKRITKDCLAIDPDDPNWIAISDKNLELLKTNKLVIEIAENGYSLWISKGIFGNIKKTHAIYHRVIKETESDMIVLFRQVETGYDIYHLCKFLKFQDD